MYTCMYMGFNGLNLKQPEKSEIGSFEIMRTINAQKSLLFFPEPENNNFKC